MTPTPLDELLKNISSILELIGVIAVALLGYRQYRAGKQKDDIGSAAEHLVSSADKLVDMKDEEIDRLNKKINDLIDRLDRMDARNEELGKRLAGEIVLRKQHESTIDIQNKKISQYEADLAGLKIEVKALQNRVGELEIENTTLKSSLRNIGGK